MIDTNKARELAQQMRGTVGCRNCYGMDRSCTDCADRADAATLLLALADAHDAMAKALECIRNEPYTSTVDARMIMHSAMQRGKE